MKLIADLLNEELGVSSERSIYEVYRDVLHDIRNLASGKKKSVEEFVEELGPGSAFVEPVALLFDVRQAGSNAATLFIDTIMNGYISLFVKVAGQPGVGKIDPFELLQTYIGTLNDAPEDHVSIIKIVVSHFFEGSNFYRAYWGNQCDKMVFPISTDGASIDLRNMFAYKTSAELIDNLIDVIEVVGVAAMSIAANNETPVGVDSAVFNLCSRNNLFTDGLFMEAVFRGIGNRGYVYNIACQIAANLPSYVTSEGATFFKVQKSTKNVNTVETKSVSGLKDIREVFDPAKKDADTVGPSDQSEPAESSPEKVEDPAEIETESVETKEDVTSEEVTESEVSSETIKPESETTVE